MNVGELVLTIFLQSIIVAGLFYAFYRTLSKRLEMTFEELGGLFGDIFEKPNVKRAMTILGKQSGAVRANQATVNDMATQIISGPKFAGLKLGAKALGVDIDSMIEEHGAMEVMAGAQQIAGMLGINITDLVSGGLGNPLNMSNNPKISNPYLR